MNRILVIGCSGSGKSTLSRQLAERLDLPLIHLDQYYWKPGWVESAPKEWRTKVKELVAREKWLMDGNYSGTFDIRLPRADTVIFLDRPTYLCFWRVLKRTLTYRGKTRPDMTDNCPERADWKFWQYVLAYNRTRRKGILNRMNNLEDGKSFYHLRSNQDIKKLLKQLNV